MKHSEHHYKALEGQKHLVISIVNWSYTLLFVFTGRCYCYCADAAYFLHKQCFFVCWYLFVRPVPQQHLPLYAFLHWGHPWLSRYNEVFPAHNKITSEARRGNEASISFFAGCATSVLVTSAGMGEMVMQVLIGSVSRTSSFNITEIAFAQGVK